jgi:hypothetical protein
MQRILPSVEGPCVNVAQPAVYTAAPSNRSTRDHTAWAVGWCLDVMGLELRHTARGGAAVPIGKCQLRNRYQAFARDVRRLEKKVSSIALMRRHLRVRGALSAVALVSYMWLWSMSQRYSGVSRTALGVA